MSVLINFKICDNAEECGGVEVCPTSALFWDKKTKGIAIDNNRCISCEVCVASCPVGAIKVAKTEAEYQKLEKEIEADPRKLTDLFLDRYGAMPIVPAFQALEKDFENEVVKSGKVTAVELYNEGSINCLLKSIPITELLSGYDILYKKVETSKGMVEKLNLTALPSLLFYKEGKMIGKIEGYFENTETDKLKEQIAKIISEAN